MSSSEKPITEQHIYFIIEAAGWIHGEFQARIDNLMGQLIKRLRRIQGGMQNNVIIKVSAIEYNTYCRWIPECMHTPVADVAWPGVSPGGLSDLGSALIEIEKELPVLDVLASPTEPIFIFIAGGLPTDNFQCVLSSLSNNLQYQSALKIAFGIPSLIGYDKYILTELTGSADTVFDFDQISLFTPLVKNHLESKLSEI